MHVLSFRAVPMWLHAMGNLTISLGIADVVGLSSRLGLLPLRILSR